MGMAAFMIWVRVWDPWTDITATNDGNRHRINVENPNPATAETKMEAPTETPKAMVVLKRNTDTITIAVIGR